MKNHTKRALCVILSILMLLTLLASCGEKNEYEAELSDIAEANNTKSLLETYDSILVTYDDSTGLKHGCYMDHEIGSYWGDAFTDADGKSHEAYGEVTTALYQAGFEGDQPYSVLYAGGDIDSSWFKNIFVNPEILVLETVESIEEKDGLITYRTRLSMVDLVDRGLIADAETINHYYITEYTIDAKTLHFQSIKEMYYNKDDVLESSYVCTVEYDKARPEMVESIMEMHDETETCTVSVVKDMGKDNESAETFTIPKGNKLYFYWYGEYQSVYSDRDCKIDFEDGSVINGDLTIYLK
jgi:hypothetical protein